MSERPRTRQELYEQLRNMSKQDFIRRDMIRLGFWPAEEPPANDPQEEVERISEIERELRTLRSQASRIRDEEKLRKHLYRKRLEASRQRRAERKAERERERRARAEAWRRRKQRDIVHLGTEVSGGLEERDSDRERLEERGLPVMSEPADLAEAMGITIGKLRWLAFARRVGEDTHYVRFQIPKKTGGTREISAPMPDLKKAQHWILREILEKLEPHDAAHGFRRGRSIVTNARPHVGADIVINMDLEDFFPTVTYRRIKGLFISFGYSEAVATILGLLCSEPDVAETELDGRTYYVARGERHLPQGAPTSPAITNLMCRRLDRRLEGLGRSLGFETYTRYADDLSFSGPDEASPDIGKLLARARWVVEDEGFFVHPDKTRVLRNSNRQEVTGIVVNEKLGVERATLKRFRATLHHIELDGPEGKHWGASPDVLASIHGFANFVAMVDPEKGAKLVARVEKILEEHDHPGVIGTPPSGGGPDASIPDASAPGEASDDDSGEGDKRGKWWKLW